MYQKWSNGATIKHLEKENNLRKDAIYKRFGSLPEELLEIIGQRK